MHGNVYFSAKHVPADPQGVDVAGCASSTTGARRSCRRCRGCPRPTCARPCSPRRCASRGACASKWLDAATPTRRATSFAVYRVVGDAAAIDVEDAANLVATLRTTGGTEQGWLDAGAEAGTRHTYAVTALDRVWNETAPSRVRTSG